ncbi:MAG: hypothetical protein RLZZ407_822 [Pseudomonadota bacterium]
MRLDGWQRAYIAYFALLVIVTLLIFARSTTLQGAFTFGTAPTVSEQMFGFSSNELGDELDVVFSRLDCIPFTSRATVTKSQLSQSKIDHGFPGENRQFICSGHAWLSDYYFALLALIVAPHILVWVYRWIRKGFVA